MPQDRPRIVEIVVVLAICLGLLMGLATVDDRAARREAARAGAVLAERAKVSAERAARESMTAPAAPVAPAGARTDRLGRETSPLVVPAGRAWGAATSVVSHTQRSDPKTPGATAAAKPFIDTGPVLLLLMGGAGLSMIGAGLRLLSRRSA